LDNLSKHSSCIKLGIPEAEGNWVISRNDELRSKVGEMSIIVSWLLFLCLIKYCRYL